MIPFAATTVTENPLSSSNNTISMSWSYNSSPNYTDFLNGATYGTEISGTISEFLNVPYDQSKNIKWISFPFSVPGPAIPLYTLSSDLGFYNKLTDLCLNNLENPTFTCTSNAYLNRLSVILCDGLKQIDLSKNPSLFTISILLCNDLNNYITTSLSGNYSLFKTENYVGVVSQSYLSGSCLTSSIYVSGSSRFNSNKYSGYVSGTYGDGIPITSNLTNYNGPITGSISGNISGSFTGLILFSSGSLSNFTGSLDGNLIGNQYTYTPAININNCPTLEHFFIYNSYDMKKIDVTNNTNLDIFSINYCTNLTDIIGVDKLTDLTYFKIIDSNYINWSLINVNGLIDLMTLWISGTNIQKLNIGDMIQLFTVNMSDNTLLTEITSSANYLYLNYLNFQSSSLSLNSVNSLYVNLSSSMKNNNSIRLNGTLNLNKSPLPTTSPAINAKSYLQNTMGWTISHTP